ncbi:class II aldolase/adducin family protein [Planctomycetota bacterium]
MHGKCQIDIPDLLAAITALSHEFGSMDYVCAGGGNTSAKNETTLWAKPSGTTLAGLTPEVFVAIDRAALGELYTIETPADPHAREMLVKDKMAAAVLPGCSGRASVEAPLHDSLSATFVVHTHPALVNGMTCAKDGKAVAQRLFPEALWLDYIDPGYILSIRGRHEIQAYKQRYGIEPAVIFLKNHGVFVAGDTADTVRVIHRHLIQTLKTAYQQAGVTLTCTVNEANVSAESLTRIRHAFQDDSVAVAARALFPVAVGPISPDHIVYARSYPLAGKPSVDTVSAYHRQHGYNPKILIWDQQVYAVDETERKAALALQLAHDGAWVEQLAQASGGIEYMTDSARIFIENWEVESYRSQQM